jgi:hypothetical protein
MTALDADGKRLKMHLVDEIMPVPGKCSHTMVHSLLTFLLQCRGIYRRLGFRNILIGREGIDSGLSTSCARSEFPVRFNLVRYLFNPSFVENDRCRFHQSTGFH